MDRPVIELIGVTKEYGARVRTRVLHGVDLTIYPGEFSAVTGPSGSGKSTMLNLIGLLERPTEGSIVAGGEDTGALSDDQRATLRNATLGFVFQFHHLLPAFTALENVVMPMVIREGRRTAGATSRGMALLERVGIVELADRKTTDMSGGQQQRVAVARALAASPALLLADEPTGNLDTRTADQVFDLLRSINEEDGMAVLVVTHDPRLADRCDRIIRVVDGQVSSDAPGPPRGPCRACGYAPRLREGSVRAEEMPGRE